MYLLYIFHRAQMWKFIKIILIYLKTYFFEHINLVITRYILFSFSASQQNYINRVIAHLPFTKV